MEKNFELTILLSFILMDIIINSGGQNEKNFNFFISYFFD